MKANELRVGNWYDDNKIPKQVTPNTIEEVWEAERLWCQPIPITGEWLLKFGFEKDNRANWRLKSGYHWIEIYFYHVYINGQQVVLIDYVHQLQNIWFALTGKELTYGGNN
jgi:hypothetical protein